MSVMCSERPRSVVDVLQVKQGGQRRKLVMLTAYDAPSARIARDGGADMLLVGDSVAMTVQGKADTNSVTMDEMIYHMRLVTAAVPDMLVVGDMPFLSYETGPEQAVLNAGRLFREGGVRAVKVEGGQTIVPQIRAMTEAGIPVMGHLGLTPQRAATLGGFRAQARTAAGARGLMADALALEEAGCFALVLECVPARVAERVTARLSIPTIGIGAGSACDGQVLVFHDLLGLGDRKPKFVKAYAQLGQIARQAVADYAHEVREGSFPSSEHTFSISDEEWEVWIRDEAGHRHRG